MIYLCGMRQVCESIQYAGPPVWFPSIQATVQLRFQSTVQVQPDDNKTYFLILLFPYPSIPWLTLRHSVILLIQSWLPWFPEPEMPTSENGFENVIYTQSRWVLKGQICNLLTSLDVVPHLPAASDEMGGKEKLVWCQKGEMWIRIFNHVLYIVPCTLQGVNLLHENKYYILYNHFNSLI